MAVTDEINKGRPPLRIWELNETSTRFDHLLAAPSDKALHRYWTAWAAIALFVGLFILVVLLGVVSARTARQHTFNLYLIFLMIPDCLFSLLCGTTCLLNSLNGEYWSHWMCNFQQFYCVWGIGSNTFLNAAVTYQLHKLLRYSHARRRYILPSAWEVSRQCLCIYLYTAFIATWGLIESPKFPFYSAAPSGLACIPVEADRRSAIFFWVVFFPLFAGIPTFYVFYACYDVWKRKLLPPTGKRRLLVIYFGRIVLVFISVWVPYFVLLFCFATLVPPSVHFAGGTLAHLQGITSAIVSMMKPDIMTAVKKFVWGGCCSEAEDINLQQWQVSSAFCVQNNNNVAGGPMRGDGAGAVSSLDLAVEDGTDRLQGSIHSAGEVGSAVETESYLTSASLWPNEDGEYEDEPALFMASGNNKITNDSNFVGTARAPALSRVPEESSCSRSQHGASSGSHCNSQRGSHDEETSHHQTNTMEEVSGSTTSLDKDSMRTADDVV